jgi:ATP-binding cassette subfamily B protein/subfamily B ATP-binding cassette protein MsbA
MAIPNILSPDRNRLFVKLIAIGLAQALLTIVTALLIRFVFDRWITGIHHDLGVIAVVTAAALMLTTCFSALMRYAERVNAERLGQQYTYEVRLALYDQLVSIAPWTLQKRSRGGHLLRFIGDLTALRQWLSQGLATLIVALVTSVIAISALAFINAFLAFTVFFILLAGAGIAMISGQTMHERIKDARDKRARIAANVNEKLATLPVVQVFNQIKRERNVLSKQSRRLQKAMISRAKVMGQLRGVTEATNGFATLCVLFVGAHEVSQGRTSPGMVVASMSILGMLLPSFRNLGRIYEYWHSYQVSLQRIETFMNTSDLIVDRHKTRRLKITSGEIRFENVSMGDVFSDLNGTVTGGMKLAVVGPNGAGKSTLIDMIGRLVDPDSGKIFIDDQAIKRCSLTSIRRVIGMVSPDLPLLRGSIERNLRYRKRNASIEELEQVCQLCGVDKVIAELPDGLNTRVTDGGVNFSFGQRQRIALARALLGSPQILLLDEADANLDHTTKQLLDDILDNYQGTVIMVSHQYDRIIKADQIWHLDEGRIIESGTPSDLFTKSGATSALFNVHLKTAV